MKIDILQLSDFRIEFVSFLIRMQAVLGKKIDFIFVAGVCDEIGTNACRARKNAELL